jgi:ABC-2 type transport system ATP-binding protein
MREGPVIEVKNLVKRYGELAAVDAVSFEVERGEIFGLLGPNGAGKTTTIGVLSCLVKPTSGSAKVAGIDVTRDSLGARSRIGVVPQEIALYPTLSARDNMLFWGRMYGVAEAELAGRIDELLEVVQLAGRARDRIDTFSGGMKRRVNIAVGLLHRPEVLFLDEPTVGIDPQTRRSILELVKDLNDQGLTVLYTTHYLEEAEFLCDRIGIMDEGRMLAVGTKSELTALVGAESVITVRADGMDASLVNWLEPLEGVSDAALGDGDLTVSVTTGSNVLPPLVERLTSSGTSIHSIDVDVPNLEGVFLHLTGKSLRDEADEAPAEDPAGAKP